MRVLRTTAVVLLLALPLAPEAFASPPHPATPVPAGRGDFLQQIRSFLVSLWSPEGCLMDPWGRCLANATPATDAGCLMDPWGRCRTSPTLAADAGCGMDPLGRCATSH